MTELQILEATMLNKMKNINSEHITDRVFSSAAKSETKFIDKYVI